MTKTGVPHPTDASIILTYRCPMRCQMCNIWHYPTKRSEKISRMFASKFDYENIAKFAMRNYDAEKYYNELMHIYS